MDVLPADVELQRTTPVFDETTVPRGLLNDHRVAPGVWGRLVVSEGELRFRFEDEDADRHLTAPATLVIAPDRLHRVVTSGPVRFVVEFYKPPASDDERLEDRTKRS